MAAGHQAYCENLRKDLGDRYDEHMAARHQAFLEELDGNTDKPS